MRSDDGPCASGGIYFPTITRSAAPGTCPADLALIDPETLIIDDREVCGTERSVFDGGGVVAGGGICSEEGTEELVVTAAGIRGAVTIKSDCWGDGSVRCTASYDIVYTPAAPPEGA